jgi:hypothetical protein
MGMTLDFDKFESGDEIEIEYTVYDTIGHNTKEKQTTVATVVSGINEAGNIEWKAGSTGTGVIRKNGHVFDGNGLKIGINASIEKM